MFLEPRTDDQLEVGVEVTWITDVIDVLVAPPFCINVFLPERHHLAGFLECFSDRQMRLTFLKIL